ncbi:MAG TPA: hypothetical protein VGF01_15135 [Terracidiphilus sp.]|jgi:hypothetical protein
MPIEFKKNRVIFRDVARVEEAEALLEALQKKPTAKVDLAACTHLHTANLQVLMVARPSIDYWPQDAELRTWLEAVLKPA